MQFIVKIMLSWCKTSKEWAFGMGTAVLAVAWLCANCIRVAWEPQTWLISGGESKVLSYRRRSDAEDYSSVPSFGMRKANFQDDIKMKFLLPQNEVVVFLKIFVVKCMPLALDWWSHNINCFDFIGVIFFIVTVWDGEVIHRTLGQ